MSSKQRDRGRILTPDGLSRLQQAIRAWELKHEVRCTQERIKELTSAVKEGGLDPGTTRKILRAKEGVDPESIRCLFTTFGLQLDEVDLAPSSRLQVQVDPNFVGREGAIADLNTLVSRGAKVIIIQARGGVGKTTLARKYLQQEFGSFLEFPIAKETKDIASIESLIEEKLRQLGEEPGREFFVSLDRLKRKLQDERIGILIDNLEPALDSAGKFIEPHRRYVELLRILTDPTVQSVTFITSRERLRESSVTVEHYMLRSLDIEAWVQFFQSRNLATDTPAFAALHNAYGGNAKAMDIIRGAILEDYAGDVAAYWHANQHDLFIERDLEDLVTQQFDRLQQIDPDAYNLLCRMGCYRYQDVPTVPIEGLLCLLWDVPENRQRRVVKSLQDRSLMELENGEYWLHPVIRGEAISRLRASEDWEVSNKNAAEYCTHSVSSIETIKDALLALEAYHHYFQIDDFVAAFSVLARGRKNQWNADNDPHGEPLVPTLYRLGLIQKVLPAAINVMDCIEPGFTLAEMCNALGEIYYQMGQIKKAITHHERAFTIAKQFNDEYIIEISSGNLGLCKIELWKLEEAFEFFKDFIKQINQNPRWRIYASFCLAFLYSCLNHPQKAYSLAEDVYNRLLAERVTSWGMGYGLIFLGWTYKNIEQIDKAFEVYNKAVDFAKKTDFLQVRAKSLNGLAELHRMKGAIDLALASHLESLEILNSIGAKSDLAEVYYQLGLTYQVMRETEKSNKSFEEAIQFFTEMEAPKQVERVRRSMQTDTGN